METFKDLLDQFIRRIGKDIGNDEVRSKAKEILNSQYQFVSSSYFWKGFQKRQELTIVKNFTDGTASITKGSRTVSISGGTLTSNMAGRFFSHQDSQGDYLIRYVDTSANVLILESPIVEDTESGISYKIKKKYYTLNSDVRLIENFNDSRLNEYRQDTIPNRSSLNPYESNPFREAGTDLFTSPYTTGTITLSKNSNLAVGNGTSWLSNATPGAKLKVEGNIFRIKRVESDTRIIMLNYSKSDISTNDYSIDEDNPRQIEIVKNQGDSGKDIIIPVDYFSYAYPMVNEEKDSMQISHPYFKEAVMKFSEAEYLSDPARDVNESNSSYLKAQLYLEGLKANYELVSVPYRMFHPTIPRGFGRG